MQRERISVDGEEMATRKSDLTGLRSRIGMDFRHFGLCPHASVLENP